MSNLIRFECIACGKRLKAPQEFAGRRVKCGSGQAQLVSAATPVYPAPEISMRDLSPEDSHEPLVSEVKEAPKLRETLYGMKLASVAEREVPDPTPEIL